MAFVEKVPKGRVEEALVDRKPLLSAHDALVEANRCLYCTDAPCIPSCPTAINIPEFIRRISTGNLEGSAKTIFQSNILGYSCARVCPVEVLCESTCVFNELSEPPIRIGKLQRYATEGFFEAGHQFFEAGESTGKTIALIGAGPASLACAHELRQLGHNPVIFEGRSLVGGLNTTGVAPYKIQADAAVSEVDWVLGIGGIEIKTGVKIGEDVSLSQLEADYDGIFVGVGLGPDSYLGAEGEGLDGVWGAVDWIEHMKNNADYQLPSGVKTACILGGGNTAIDVVRELSGLGVDDVRLVYRRDEGAMSGYKHEWRWAKIENVRGTWHAQPIGLVGDNGKLTAVRCVKTENVAGKLRYVDGSEFEIPCQIAFLAIGQSKLGAMFEGVDGFTTERGRIVTNPASGRVGDTKYFAGGDCANGGKEVVNAAAEGKVAAHGIDAFLNG